MKIEFGNQSHVGNVRKQNEDYLGSFECRAGTVFIVCDGMGGHKGGAMASTMAVDAFKHYLQKELNSDQPINKGLYDAFVYANKLIFDKAQRNNDLQGMGTTCVMLLVDLSGNCHYAHIGDSRIYEFKNGFLKRLTKDHSYVQTLIDGGIISDEEAERSNGSPKRHQSCKPFSCLMPCSP